MSAELPGAVLDRLRAVDWDGDWDEAYSHTRSRALLMREYMRRAALWAREYGAETQWPFFDVAEFVAPRFQLDPEVADALDDYVRQHVGTPSLPGPVVVQSGGAAVQAMDSVALPDLPDPYEPLLLMYERGGGYWIEVLIDLNGVAIPFGNIETNIRAKPFVTLDRSTLDALDQDGKDRITYYAKVSERHPRSDPRGIVRRRMVGPEAHTRDEAFTRNLRWEPTEYLRLYELGHNDVDHVEITEIEAAEFIESATKKLTGTA